MGEEVIVIVIVSFGVGNACKSQNSQLGCGPSESCHRCVRLFRGRRLLCLFFLPSSSSCFRQRRRHCKYRSHWMSGWGRHTKTFGRRCIGLGTKGKLRSNYRGCWNCSILWARLRASSKWNACWCACALLLEMLRFQNRRSPKLS